MWKISPGATESITGRLIEASRRICRNVVETFPGQSREYGRQGLLWEWRFRSVILQYGARKQVQALGKRFWSMRNLETDLS